MMSLPDRSPLWGVGVCQLASAFPPKALSRPRAPYFPSLIPPHQPCRCRSRKDRRYPHESKGPCYVTSKVEVLARLVNAAPLDRTV
ncbi:hypothetical protein SODALDRAFT_328765 [Sodiomyces alkalinus F11]|uniref:Uncharacterized protein n=1 Tax=Sodiomyces alkalinus (strain CBS 110278 / VKM F-3762 / F11) TaxID=1314773 RepID=A0A3N2PLL9_SODAK|nr:hypothetical protein SODALDRAFT_328765 [Sodiomyces alkalinus F11]ROT35423.1 hypothetical protein SODALDRAFT_328765 [Sodiomyces alkalinus F11]